MLSDFISLFFPNYCLACNGNLVKGEKMVCMKCDQELPKTQSHLINENFIAIKFYGKLQLTHAIALYKYTKKGRVQRLLRRLKYENCPELGELLGNRYGVDLTATNFQQNYDLIIPVPLHKSKFKRRGYNQSTAFAEGLAKNLGLPVNDQLVVRSIKTATQTRKSRIERWKNVESIFLINNATEIENKRILLVDDVITTGATLESCGLALLEAGCRSVGVAAIAAAQ